MEGEEEYTVIWGPGEGIDPDTGEELPGIHLEEGESAADVVAEEEAGADGPGQAGEEDTGSGVEDGDAGGVEEGGDSDGAPDIGGDDPGGSTSLLAGSEEDGGEGTENPGSADVDSGGSEQGSEPTGTVSVNVENWQQYEGVSASDFSDYAQAVEGHLSFISTCAVVIAVALFAILGAIAVDTLIRRMERG